MADVITFPTTNRTRPVAPAAPGQRRFGVVANLYLMGGKLGFSLLYPEGRVGPSTVAMMLRRAADELDKKT